MAQSASEWLREGLDDTMITSHNETNDADLVVIDLISNDHIASNRGAAASSQPRTHVHHMYHKFNRTNKQGQPIPTLSVPYCMYDQHHEEQQRLLQQQRPTAAAASDEQATVASDEQNIVASDSAVASDLIANDLISSKHGAMAAWPPWSVVAAASGLATVASDEQATAASDERTIVASDSAGASDSIANDLIASNLGAVVACPPTVVASSGLATVARYHETSHGCHRSQWHRHRCPCMLANRLQAIADGDQQALVASEQAEQPEQAEQHDQQSTHNLLLSHQLVNDTVTQDQMRRWRANTNLLGGAYVPFEQYRRLFGTMTDRDPWGNTIALGMCQLLQQYLHNWRFPEFQTAMGWFLAPQPFSYLNAQLAPATTDEAWGGRRNYYPAFFRHYGDDDLVDMACLFMVVRNSRVWSVHRERVHLWHYVESATAVELTLP